MKLKSLSLEEKNKVLDRVDAGESMRLVCEEFGIKSSTFYDIKKSRDKIRKYSLSLEDPGRSKKVQKRIKPTMFVDLDQAVYKWYKHERASGINVRGVDIQNTAVSLAKHLKIRGFHASAGTMSKVTPQKGKRVRLSVEKKLEIVEKLEKGTSVSSIMAEYAISRTQVYDIRATKKNLRDYSLKTETCVTTKEKKSALSIKSIKKPKFSTIDEAVYDWYREQRAEGVPVRGIELQAVAMRIASILNIEGFQASGGWLQKFSARHNISNQPIGGENSAQYVEESDQLRLDNSLL
ncbi:Tigger transposable element-derived protein 7-like 27, partial [Homarus americanus]